jgi:aryl-alcohol dehydrogenase-like predicted oxidoreductase
MESYSWSLQMTDLFASIPSVGKMIFRIVMGTATLSPPDKGYAFPLLDEFTALGGNAVETAHSYGDGDCERVIGQWVKERKNREQIAIITKGGHPFDGRSRLSRECIDADLDESLRRLQTDYIDLYLLHRDDTKRAVGDIVDSLNKHFKSGKIRAFGGSNWTPERIDAANRYAREAGLEPLRVSSPNFSLALPAREPWPGCLSVTKESFAWYKKSDVKMLSWSSQARGFFTGRFSVEQPDELGVLNAWFTDENYERLNRAKVLAQRKGVSPNTIALAYVLSQSFAPMAAIGSRTIEELRDSFTAATCKLSGEELSWLKLE